MANPGDQGTLEFWLWDTQPMVWLRPKSGDMGDMETWLWDTQPPEEYAATPATGVTYVSHPWWHGTGIQRIAYGV